MRVLQDPAAEVAVEDAQEEEAEAVPAGPSEAEKAASRCEQRHAWTEQSVWWLSCCWLCSAARFGIPTVQAAAAKLDARAARFGMPTKAAASEDVAAAAAKKEARAARFGMPTKAAASEAAAALAAKKEARAARFGMPTQADATAVDEKKKARAERFGTGNGTAVAKPKIGLSDEVLKKRAERFGIPVTGAVAANDLAEKKRQRAERFGNAEGGDAKKAKAE